MRPAERYNERGYPGVKLENQDSPPPIPRKYRLGTRIEKLGSIDSPSAFMIFLLPGLSSKCSCGLIFITLIALSTLAATSVTRELTSPCQPLSTPFFYFSLYFYLQIILLPPL